MQPPSNKPAKADGAPAENTCDDEGTQRRFEKLVRTALNTPPKPMKEMPRKRPAIKANAEKAAKG